MTAILGCLLGFFAGAAVTLAAQRLAGGGSLRQRRAAAARQERLQAIWRNVEAYDGTAAGQKPLP